MAGSRRLAFTFVGLSLGFALASCNLFGPSDADVLSAFSVFKKAYASAMQSQTTSGSTLTATGYDDQSIADCKVQYDLSDLSKITGTITLNNFSDYLTTGYTADGALNVTGNTNGSSQSFTMTGTLNYSWSYNVLSSQGKVTDLNFNVTYSSQSGSGSWSGTVTANGSTQVKAS